MLPSRQGPETPDALAVGISLFAGQRPLRAAVPGTA
jgi:hypothetical protein